ncbi:MAG: ribbon-helix-helix protein, CopG family [Actinomycetota bacterium]
MKRMQVCLEGRQARELARRAAAEHTTRSQLVRDALDAYLGKGDETEALQRFRDAVDAVAGVAPYLPERATYVRRLRAPSR